MRALASIVLVALLVSFPWKSAEADPFTLEHGQEDCQRSEPLRLQIFLRLAATEGFHLERMYMLEQPALARVIELARAFYEEPLMSADGAQVFRWRENAAFIGLRNGYCPLRGLGFYETCPEKRPNCLTMIEFQELLRD